MIKNKVKIEGSNQISEIAYDQDSENLYVKFVRGSWYEYSGVPLSVYAEFLASESKGSYHYRNIKGKYLYRQVKDE